MKAYILTLKNLPEYSHEVHIILANDKKELKTVMKENSLDSHQFDVQEKTKTGLIYTDVY